MKHILTNPYHEVIRLDEGEEALKKLADFAEEKKIEAGWVFAIGSASEIEISYYDTGKKEYVRKIFKEPLEIINISGNIALKDGERVCHLHGSFGRTDYGTISGHIHSLAAAATIEVFIHKIDGRLNRAYDEKTGLNLLS